MAIWLKGMLLTAIGLAASYLPRLSASLRHFILLASLLGLALLPVAELLSPLSVTMVRPAGMEQWIVDFDLSAMSAGTDSSSGGSHVYPGLTELVVVYFSVSLLLLGYWSAQIWRARRWVSQARVIDPTMTVVAQVSGGATSRKVSLRQSTVAGSPLTWGVFRPCIVVPSDWDNWSEEQRHAALVHELSHIIRFDTLTTSLCFVICLAFWANPLVWWTHQRLRQTAERAADDAVVDCGVSPTEYAGQLLNMARATNLNATAAMASGSHLYRRVAALLDGKTRRTKMKMIHCVVVAASVVAVLVPMGSLQAESVGEAALVVKRDVPALSESVYDVLANAQRLVESGNSPEAITLLVALRDAGGLNDYERAQVWNTLAYAHYRQGDTPGTIAAYEQVLVYRHSITEALERAALRALFQLQFGQNEYVASISLIDQYLELKGADPTTTFIKATALYQLKRWEAALTVAEEAESLSLSLDEQVPERCLRLQAAINTELGRPMETARVLERLMTLYPSAEYERELNAIRLEGQG